MLTSDKADQSKSATRDKESNYIMIRWSIYKAEIIVIMIYVSNLK
jgi:hypothetical protein